MCQLQVTPGPWTAYSGKDTNWWWIVETPNGELGSGDGGYDENDARLMAKAPELYEALEKCANELNMMIERHNIQSMEDGSWEYDQETVHNAMVLLAQARGECK